MIGEFRFDLFKKKLNQTYLSLYKQIMFIKRILILIKNDKYCINLVRVCVCCNYLKHLFK